MNKTLGMTFYDRLLFLEAEMNLVSSKYHNNNSKSSPIPEEMGEQVKEYFNSLVLFSNQEKNISLLGHIEKLPTLNPEERIHLEMGKTVVLNYHVTPLSTRILMIRSIQHNSNKQFLFGIVNDLYLWGIPDKNNLTGNTEFSVLDESNNLLISSMSSFTGFSNEVLLQMTRSASGQFEWESGKTGYLASYWSLFLKERFYIPKWTVVVTQSKADIYSSALQFMNLFPLIIVMSILMVMLISIGQIRKNLRPLLLLKEGTRRIAEKDFSNQVMVKSSDEFEEVADSFNKMASQLGKQFNTLTTIGQIHRAILSTLDIKKITEIIIRDIPFIFPCNYISSTLIYLGDAGLAQSTIRNSDSKEEYLVENITITSDAVKELINNPQYFSIKWDQNFPSHLQPLAACGIKYFFIFPIILDRTLKGFITLGNFYPPHYSEEDLSQIRQLSDQAAVAFSNAFMVQKTYALAYYDQLTKLPNLLLFKERLNELLLSADFYKKMLGIIVLDIDHFKRINDTLGRSMGDELLRQISGRLTECFKIDSKGKDPNAEDKMVACFGGDEFIILLSNVNRIEELRTIAENVLKTFSKPFSLSPHNIFITASIGIALYPANGENMDNLLKNADTALHFAKSKGRNNYQFFTSSMNSRALTQLSLGNELRLALEREEFELHYQPMLDIRTRQIIGMEALVRWRHPEKGLISPGIFIPLAEELGLIFRLGEWVLHKACVQNKAWQTSGLAHIPVAVNLSSYQFQHGELKDTIVRTLRESGLGPEYLELELTEGAIMENAESTIHTLREWKEMGIHLSIDDFGTGYSSLNYLKRFPIDKIKIDRTFVMDINLNPDDAAIVTAIIVMAHSLKLKVIAEGVETEEQLAFLLAHGCDEIQGFLFSRPLPADVFETLLQGVNNRV
ncbi:MAG: EAL domain-containing protein [Nitrospirae bacterium]|nr:EAL domain-containing protein [Nitrospirota bacterium]MBI3593930.1 EAL domain-containing protein [Nitrospirota bacterium]